jgi:regulator of sigma D
MPVDNKNPREQFQAVDSLLTVWLKERRALLSAYTSLVVSLDNSLPQAGVARHQADLCELLVDYVSAGHFEVFHRLVEEAESFGDGSSALAAELMPDIGDTTEVILAYEDKYADCAVPCDKLSRDLSALGEILETRFVLEDRLIAGLHNSHRRLLTAPAQPA